MEIGTIPSPLFADYIRAQFDRTNRGVSDEAVERLLAVTGGHPYATQELAFALWDVVPEGFTATVADFDAALEAVLRSENARFTLVWENATSLSACFCRRSPPSPAGPSATATASRTSCRRCRECSARSGRSSRTSSCARRPRALRAAEPFLSEWVLGYAS